MPDLDRATLVREARQTSILRACNIFLVHTHDEAYDICRLQRFSIYEVAKGQQLAGLKRAWRDNPVGPEPSIRDLAKKAGAA